MPSIAGKLVNKVLKDHISKQAPEDPLYTVTVNSKGKSKRQVVSLPYNAVQPGEAVGTFFENTLIQGSSIARGLSQKGYPSATEKR